MTPSDAMILRITALEAAPVATDENGRALSVTCPDWECLYRLPVADTVVAEHNRCGTGGRCPYSGAVVDTEPYPEPASGQ